jgi:hypothetical protein
MPCLLLPRRGIIPSADGDAAPHALEYVARDPQGVGPAAIRQPNYAGFVDEEPVDDRFAKSKRQPNFRTSQRFLGEVHELPLNRTR